MQPNAGGVVDPDDLVGRDVELEQLLTAIGHDGARLLGDRRIGKTSLLGLLAEATGRSGPQYRTILILDEVTVLAEALGRDDPHGSEAFMHSLRAPRQQHPRVAMVIAGSVGLRHIIGDVKVVNDLTAIELGPWDDDDAVYLARRLLRGTGLAADREREVAQDIVDLTDAPAVLHPSPRQRSCHASSLDHP